MCGRFVSSSPPADLAAYFDADASDVDDLGARYNVAPTLDVYVVGERLDPETGERERKLRAHRWGLVPFWADDPKIGNRMINARAETVASSNAFKQAFQRGRRCIIPADGFYEWSAVEGHKKKQPWYAERPDHRPLALAGLWERWRDAEGNTLRSCVIITTDANEAMAPIHDRMPVVLPEDAWAAWLDPANDAVDALTGLLVPAPDDLLSIRPVSLEVSNVRNDGPDLLVEAQPLEPAGA